MNARMWDDAESKTVAAGAGNTRDDLDHNHLGKEAGMTREQSSYLPELGQMAFSNTPWQPIESPRWINTGLEMIAENISAHRGRKPDDWAELTSNAGGDPWETEVFAMRSYCWCDGGFHDEEVGCPPNFEHHSSGLIINWYKHSLRGRSQNMDVDQQQWLSIVSDCIADVQAATK